MIQSQGSASLVRQPMRFRSVGPAGDPNAPRQWGPRSLALPSGPESVETYSGPMVNSIASGGKHRITDEAPVAGPEPYRPTMPGSALPPSYGGAPGVATMPGGFKPNVTQAGPAGNPWEAGSGPATPAALPGESGGLRGETYLPGNDPRLTGAQGATDAAAAGVQGAPSISDETQSLYGRYRSLLSGGQSRFDAAKGVLQNLDENQGLQRTQGVRQIGQAAAALGRTGAGMTTNDLTGLETSLNRNREQSLRQLSADTTEGDINDRFRTLDAGFQGATANSGDRYRRLDAARGVEGGIFGQGQANRDEYRTERGRQDALGQQSLDNKLKERQQQQAEMEARWRRAMGLANVGGQGAPSLDDILRMSH